MGKRLLDVAMCGVTAAVYAAAFPCALLSGVLPATWGQFRTEPRPDERWIIVLGCGFAVPDMLNSRVDAAVRAWQSKPECRLLLSGNGDPMKDETAYMAARCENAGVPEERLRLDGTGFCTKDTMVNAARMGVNRAFVVSSDYHIQRCVYQARRAGIDAVGLRVPIVRLPWRWRYWLRDAAATVKAVASRYDTANPPRCGKAVGKPLAPGKRDR